MFVPIVMTATLAEPRAAPRVASASAARLASLSTLTGRWKAPAKASRMRVPPGIPKSRGWSTEPARSIAAARPMPMATG